MDNDDKLKPESSPENKEPKTKEEPSVQEVMDEIAEIEKEIKYVQKKERKPEDTSQSSEQQSQPQPQSQPQDQTRGSSFSRTPNQSIPRPSRTYRRAQRARRRYGAGGYAKSAGKKIAKKGAVTFAAWLAANWWIVVIIGAIIAVVVAFIIIIAAIINACENFWDDPLGNAPFALIGTVTGLCTSSPDGISIEVPPNPPGITTTKEGPFSIGNDENLLYTIKVTYDPSVNNAILDTEYKTLNLFDVPLFEYELVSASGTSTTGTGSDGRKYINWPISDNPGCVENYTCTFSLVLNPNQQDFIARNTIYVSDVYKVIIVTASENSIENAPTVNSGPEVKACDARNENDIWYGADCAPTDDTCGGRWRDQMYGNDRLMGTKNIVEKHIELGHLSGARGTGYNFGDPLCSFKAAKVDAVIDSLVEAGVENKTRGEFWKDIAYCEGTPNSFGTQGLTPGDLRPMGPAGYFQMGIGQPIVFKEWQEDAPNKGDVPWQRQIQNAIN